MISIDPAKYIFVSESQRMTFYIAYKFDCSLNYYSLPQAIINHIRHNTMGLCVRGIDGTFSAKLNAEDLNTFIEMIAGLKTEEAELIGFA